MKMFAYLVLDVLVEPIDPLLELPSDVQPPLALGEIMLSAENFGNGGHTFGEELGLARVTYSVQYLATGDAEDDGTITFGLGEKRLLNLISIGLRNEQVLKDQIHEFADKAKEKIEEMWTTSQSEDFLGDTLRAVDQLEKRFFDRKDR